MARLLRIAQFAGLLILMVGYVSGCSRPEAPDATQPSPSDVAQDQDHDHDKNHDHNKDHDDDKEAEKAKVKAEAEPTVDDAKTGMDSGEDTAIMESIRNLVALMDSDDKRLATEAGQVLLNAAKTHENIGVRTAAIAGLGAKADVWVSELSAFTAESNPPNLRLTAIEALGMASPGGEAEKRLTELTESEDPSIKRAAVTAVTALRAGAGANEIVALVAQLGQRDGDKSAQAAIALTLKGKEALPFLADAVRDSAAARQRHAATMCVALICAGTNPSQEKFAKAAHSTRKGEAQTHPAYLEGLPILAAALKDEAPMVREIAAQGLGYLGDAKATPLLAKALDDKDVHVRRRAASALCTLPAEAAQKRLEQAARRDSDPETRRFAVEALGWLGTPSVGPALIAASRDSVAEVRRAAAIQMGRIKDKSTLQSLVELFEDPNEDVRWSAVQAVAGMQDKEATQYLVAALDDPVPQVANAAEAGLQRLGVAKRRLPGAD